MGFWVFMVITGMATPLLTIVLGGVFVKNPPKTINGIYGYRTSLSRKNQQTWDFAQRYCGRLWKKIGWGMCFFTLVVAFAVRQTGENVMGCVLGLLVLLQCAVLIASTAVVERALKKKFDSNGNARV